MLNTSCFVRYFLTIILCFAYTLLWADDDIAKKYGCKNLHEIQSGEDALKQLYDNLNTDCFAKISDIELEKVWGIGVYDIAKTKEMSDKEFSKYSDKKPIFKGKMADKLIAKLIDKNISQLKLSIVAIPEESKLNIFPYADKFPDSLSEPAIKCGYPNKTYYKIGDMFIYFSNYGVYSPKCNYFWESNDKNKKLSLLILYPDDKIFPNKGSIAQFNFSINAD